MNSTNLTSAVFESSGAAFPSPADIQILRTTYLRGPNMWTYREVLEVWLDLGVLEDWPSHKIPGFNARLLALLPGIAQHHCGVGQEGGFLLRLQDGTWLGHVLEHIVIELLNLSGMPTGFGQTRSTSAHGVYRMVFRARNEQVALTALEQGHALLKAALNNEVFDLANSVQILRDRIDEYYLGPSTACIVAAATDRGIPHIRLNAGNLVQLGFGVAQRRIWTAETDLTSAIAEGIASDKDLTKSLLRSCGVPIPEGTLVNSPASAWEAACDIGLPVVVKPTDGNHGRGVALDLQTREDVCAAYFMAEREGSGVIVEQFISGDEHRLLVVGGRLVAATRGETARIIGDGIHNVRELIEIQINSDPRRGEEEGFPLDTIRLKDLPTAVLELQKQGLCETSIPEKGRDVLVHRTGNMNIDVTDQVHPEVAEICVLAAKKIGLDIAGIDMVTKDISQPLSMTRGAIVEVNAGPGLLMHLKPAEGEARPVGQAIIDHLFTPEQTGRIPIVGITGTKGTQLIAQWVAWFAQLDGKQVGLASQDGLYVGARCIEKTGRDAWYAARRLLINRHIEAAVIETHPLHIVTQGLAYDRCDIAIVTDTDTVIGFADHDILDAQQRFKVLRTQIDVVQSHGVAVINASDDQALALAELCDGEVILYATSQSNLALQQHLNAGGKGVYFHGHQLILVQGTEIDGVIDFAQYTKHMQSSADMQIALASVAAAWALKIPLELTKTGIDTFDMKYFTSQS